MVQLKYPSSFLLSGISGNIAIVFKEGVQVQGEVILSGEDKTINNGLMQIEEEVQITGNVYCFDKIELKGKIKGSITCNKFLLRTSSSIYENHILNGEVNLNERPENYLGVKWNNKNQARGIIKWLN